MTHPPSRQTTPMIPSSKAERPWSAVFWKTWVSDQKSILEESAHSSLGGLELGYSAGRRNWRFLWPPTERSLPLSRQIRKILNRYVSFLTTESIPWLASAAALCLEQLSHDDHQRERHSRGRSGDQQFGVDTAFSMRLEENAPTRPGARYSFRAASRFPSDHRQ